MLYTNGKIDVAPKEVGYNEARLDVLNSHFQKLIDRGEILCASYCLSLKGKVFANGAVGYRNYHKDESDPMLPDSIYRIASITKTFVAVAMMKLVEDGVTRLDWTVGDILPQFDSPPFNTITIWHLLTHTSGLHPDGGCFPNKHELNAWDLIERAYELHKPEDGAFDWIAAALANGVREKVGQQWMYSSFGFVILGVIIEKLTGVTAHQYIEDNIVKPLGMHDTAFDLTPEMAKRFVIQNERRENWIKDVLSGEDKPHPLWDKIPSTGGGMSSTPRNLVTFGNMVLSGGTLNGTRILGRKCVEKMTTTAIRNIPNYCWGANEPDRGYGVGFDMRTGTQFTFSEGTYMHEGAGASSLYIDPKEALVAAWFVPFAKEGWFSEALFNAQNIIWSGLE